MPKKPLPLLLLLIPISICAPPTLISTYNLAKMDGQQVFVRSVDVNQIEMQKLDTVSHRCPRKGDFVMEKGVSHFKLNWMKCPIQPGVDTIQMNIRYALSDSPGAEVHLFRQEYHNQETIKADYTIQLDLHREPAVNAKKEANEGMAQAAGKRDEADETNALGIGKTQKLEAAKPKTLERPKPAAGEEIVLGNKSENEAGKEQPNFELEKGNNTKMETETMNAEQNEKKPEENGANRKEDAPKELPVKREVEEAEMMQNGNQQQDSNQYQNPDANKKEEGQQLA